MPAWKAPRKTVKKRAVKKAPRRAKKPVKQFAPKKPRLPPLPLLILE
jgi:hypothetical protein